MNDKFNKHHEDPPKCPGCGRTAITIRISAQRALCLRCLGETEPDTYRRLSDWVTSNMPKQTQPPSDRVHDDSWRFRKSDRRGVYNTGTYDADGNPIKPGANH